MSYVSSPTSQPDLAIHCLKGQLPFAVNDDPIIYLDPTEPDDPTDPLTIISHRQLLRLVFMAAETGGRFERENVRQDPVAWLLAPKALFHDRPAVLACQGQDDFIGGLVLHGLSLGLDAEPWDLDDLVESIDQECFTEPAEVH
jgi:hypothetical protein